MRYLIAYDITDPRRLKQVGRLLAKHALRCQKSVFLLTEAGVTLRELLAQVAPLMDAETDLLQAWALTHPRGRPMYSIGSAGHLEVDVVVLGPEGQCVGNQPSGHPRKKKPVRPEVALFLE